MPIEQQSPPATGRINPFVFTADTNLRFALLIVAVTAASLFAFNWIHSLLHRADQAEIARCQVAAAAAFPVDPALLIGDPQQFLPQFAAQAAATDRCLTQFNQTALAWMLGGTLFLFVVTTTIYLAQPAIRIRRDKLKPLDAEKYQPLRAHLAALQQAARVNLPITFLADPTKGDSGGIAFGHLGRPYVALYGGLLVKFARDRAGFNAIVLHELAHHRNGDVNITYFAIAVWRAFVAVVLAPFAVALVVGLLVFEQLALVIDVTWRILPLVALVYIYRAAILRAREYYADIRASAWDGSPDAMTRVVAASSPLPLSGWWTKLPLPTPIECRIQSLLALHPASEARQAAIADPAQILPMSVEEYLGVGVVAGVAMPQLFFVAQLLVPTVFEPLAFVLAALFVGPLIAGVLSIGVWRMAFAQALTSRQSSRSRWLSGSLAVGMALGTFIAFDTAIPLVGPGELLPTPQERWPDALFFILWSLLMLAVIYVFVCWAHSLAKAWLPTITRRSTLGRTLQVTTAVISLCMVCWLTLLYIVYSLGRTGLAVILVVLLGGHIGSAIQFIAPLMIGSSVALWGLPLLASARRRAHNDVPHWAFLDPASAPSLSWGRITSPRPALLAGGICGLIGIALLAIINIGNGLLVPEAVLERTQFLEFYWYGQLLFAVLLQALLAGLVATMMPSGDWTHALCAVCIAGFMLALGVVVLSGLNGGTISVVFAWQVYAQVGTWGTLMAVPMALLCRSVAGKGRRERESVLTVPVEQPGRS